MSYKARKRRTKKHRREQKQITRHIGKRGQKTKPKHRGRTGRTGSMHEKKSPSKKRYTYRVIIEFSIPASLKYLTVRRG